MKTCATPPASMGTACVHLNRCICRLLCCSSGTKRRLYSVIAKAEFFLESLDAQAELSTPLCHFPAYINIT
jgi:hypothetical protein